MTQIIAIANEKGGVGKTTSTVNIGAALAALDKRVLLVDLDQQANLSDYLGYEPKSDSSTISDALYFKASGYAVDYQHLICHSKESIDFIPASKMLASITSVLGTVSNSQQVLSELLKDEHIKENYDYVLIDCRPSLDLLVVNAFAASTGVIIPVQAEKFSLDAVSSTIDTFNRARTLNHDLQLVGLLVTMVDKRTTMSKAVEKALRNNYDNVFTTVIPRLAEAAISTYEQRSLVSLSHSRLGSAYTSVANELIDICERDNKQ